MSYVSTFNFHVHNHVAPECTRNAFLVKRVVFWGNFYWLLTTIKLSG